MTPNPTIPNPTTTMPSKETPVNGSAPDAFVEAGVGDGVAAFATDTPLTTGMITLSVSYCSLADVFAVGVPVAATPAPAVNANTPTITASSVAPTASRDETRSRRLIVSITNPANALTSSIMIEN